MQNEFVCVCVTGDDNGGKSNCDRFDIGYVMMEINQQDQDLRSK